MQPFNRRFPSQEFLLENILLGLGSLWFLFQCIFFAARLREGITPDELHHIRVSLFYFESSGFSFDESPATYPFGPLNTTPYLYHLIMGKLLHLNIFGAETLAFLRWTNVLLAIPTLFLIKSLIQQTLTDSWMRVMAFFVTINIPMLAFMYAAASYDPLIILLSVWATLLLCRFVKQGKRIDLIGHLLLLGIGSLVKITMLPFFPITLLTLFIFRNELRASVLLGGKIGPREAVLLTALLIAGSLNTKMYLSNVYRYGTLMPSADQVLGDQTASKYFAQFRRDKDLTATASQRDRMPLYRFLPKYFSQVSETSFGIMAHRNLTRSSSDFAWYDLTALPFIAGLIAAIIAWVKKRKVPDIQASIAPLAISLLTGVFYTSAVISENHRVYRATHAFGLGLQGRYLFPILASAAIIFTFFSLHFLPKKARPYVAIAVSLIFVIKGFPQIASSMDASWFK